MSGYAHERGRLTVETSNVETWEDPSEDLLFLLCADIEREDEQWFVVAVEGMA